MSDKSLLALGIVVAGIMALKLLKKPDKYYGCVNNQCVEKADGQYKNDPTCQGTCAADEPCTEGATKCDGNTLFTCVNGEWQGTTCIYGCETVNGISRCKSAPPTCVEGATKCDGDSLYTCVGGEWARGTTCIYGCETVNGISRCKSAPPEIIDAEIMSLNAVPLSPPDINPGEWFNIDADIRNTGNVASKFYISISWRMAGKSWQGQDIDYDFELNDRITISPIWFLPADYVGGFWHDIKAEVYADSARTQLLDSKQINSAFYVQ